jgi:hypothetical protein
LLAFAVSKALLSTSPTSQTSTTFTYPGTFPVVSANGTSDAIVWAYENTAPAVLHAYGATNIATELYNSNQAAEARDQFGAGNKNIVPVVAHEQCRGLWAVALKCTGTSGARLCSGARGGPHGCSAHRSCSYCMSPARTSACVNI